MTDAPEFLPSKNDISQMSIHILIILSCMMGIMLAIKV